MTLTPHQRHAELQAALLDQHTPEAERLAHNLNTCGVDWQGRYPCRSPACPTCRRRNIHAQQAAALEFFADASNQDLGWMTVVLGGADDLGEADDLIARSYRATRNRINAGRRASSRWADVAIKGWHEIDALGAEHYPLLGAKRKTLLDEIAPMPMGKNGPLWVPTYHAVVQLGRLDIGELRAAFQQQWGTPGQVHVVPLQPDRQVEENITRLASYANKHRCFVRLNHVREPWPVSWQAELYAWLETKRNAFEYLRFSIRPAALQDDAVPSSVSSQSSKQSDRVCEDNSLDCPMPVLISSITIPMLY